MDIGEGCVVLNRGATPQPAEPGIGRAVLLTGNPRGGTTFIGSVAHHMGIPLGKNRPRYEDRKLRYLLLGEVPDEGHVRLEAVIRAREAQHALWGWKLPGIIQHVDLVDRLVRRPVYVLVFKDPLSIAMRRGQLGDGPILPRIRDALRFSEQMLGFLARTDRECVLVSYDKASRNPAGFIRTLADVVGLPMTDARVEEIKAAVKADSFLYDRREPSAAT